MPADRKTRTPSNLIGFKVRRLHNLLNQQWAALAPRFGVTETPVEAGILMIVGSNPGIAHKPLAAHLGVDASTLTQALAPLLSRDLVRREPSPEDRRTRCMFLTGAGEAAKTRIEALIAVRQKKLPGDLTEEEAETLHRLLDRMLARQ